MSFEVQRIGQLLQKRMEEAPESSFVIHHDVYGSWILRFEDGVAEFQVMADTAREALFELATEMGFMNG